MYHHTFQVHIHLIIFVINILDNLCLKLALELLLRECSLSKVGVGSG